jgi:uncharacterized Zn-finger protein
MNDPSDVFMEYGFSMGANAVSCPYCGAPVSCNLSIEDELECPHCGSRFENDELAG